METLTLKAAFVLEGREELALTLSLTYRVPGMLVTGVPVSTSRKTH